jgi:hypothetical protein
MRATGVAQELAGRDAAARYGGADIEFAATDDDDQLDPVAWIVRVKGERIDRRADAFLPARRRERAGARRCEEPGACRGWCGWRAARSPDDALGARRNDDATRECRVRCGVHQEDGFWSTEAYESTSAERCSPGTIRSRTTCPTATTQWQRC